MRSGANLYDRRVGPRTRNFRSQLGRRLADKKDDDGAA
jgi:hypothetical protein